MFNVLVIAYYFPPLSLSGVQRTLKFVKYMPKFNWKPIVLTTEYNAYYAYDFSLLKEIEKENIEIIRVKGKDINSLISKKKQVKMPPEIIRKFLSRISSFFFIPDNKKGWSKIALEKAREIISTQKIDLVFISAPPFSSANIGIKLKEEFDIPFVIDYRDLWFGNQFSFYPTLIHKYLIKKLEYKALKKADKIITINRRIKEKLMDYYKFVSFNDISIFPQGFDNKDFEENEAENYNTKKLIFTYSGIFYEFITPKYFLKAFKEIVLERPDIASNIELHFIGLFRNENKRLVKKLKLQEYVREFGYLEHWQVIKKIKASDVLWMMIGYGKNVDTCSSGKLYEYIGAKKTVLACVPEGIIRSTFTEYGSVFMCEPNNIQDIKKNILNIYELYRLGNLPKPNEEFIEKHRRDILTEQLTKEFQFLLKVK